MKWRFMTAGDIAGIVALNRQLQQDEGAAVMNKRIFLEVLSSNPAGHAFWQSVGFKPHSVKYSCTR